MDIKEIIDSVEQTLKDGGLQYLLVAIDTETEQWAHYAMQVIKC